MTDNPMFNKTFVVTTIINDPYTMLKVRNNKMLNIHAMDSHKSVNPSHTWVEGVVTAPQNFVNKLPFEGDFKKNNPLRVEKGY